MSNEVCECGHHRTDHIYEEAACRPGFRCEDDCNAFKSPTDNLLNDLNKALIANGTVKRCVACEVIAGVSEEARGPLVSAMAGTIGRDKLVAILARNGYNVGRRALERHRQEGHTP